MLVKCRCCGNKLERNDAFKVVVGAKNTYYCNEKEYLNLIKIKEDKDNVFLLINNIFGYKVINSALFKEINTIHEVYEYSHILAYLEENYDYIISVMNRDFVSEYAKIRYFSAILKNNIKDFQPKKTVVPKTIEVEVDMPIVNYSRKKKRRGLSEIESEID